MSSSAPHAPPDDWSSSHSSNVEVTPLLDDPLAALKAKRLLCQPPPTQQHNTNASQVVEAIIKEAAQTAKAEEKANAPTIAHFLKRNGMKPIVVVFSTTLPSPFNDRNVMEIFLRTGRLPLSVGPSQRTSSSSSQQQPPPDQQSNWRKRFSVPLSHGDETVEVTFVDSSECRNFTKKHWHGVIGVMVSNAEWPFRSMPITSIPNAAQHIRILVPKWEDNLPLPPHLVNLPVHVLRFHRGGRHVDRLLLRDLTQALMGQLDRPYDFSYLRPDMSHFGSALSQESQQRPPQY